MNNKAKNLEVKIVSAGAPCGFSNKSKTALWHVKMGNEVIGTITRIYEDLFRVVILGKVEHVSTFERAAVFAGRACARDEGIGGPVEFHREIDGASGASGPWVKVEANGRALVWNGDEYQNA